jgi:hypothetical protein
MYGHYTESPGPSRAVGSGLESVEVSLERGLMGA